jgi:hypothetical protein
VWIVTVAATGWKAGAVDPQFHHSFARYFCVVLFWKAIDPSLFSSEFLVLAAGFRGCFLFGELGTGVVVMLCSEIRWALHWARVFCWIPIYFIVRVRRVILCN